VKPGGTLSGTYQGEISTQWLLTIDEYPCGQARKGVLVQKAKQINQWLAVI
jgi:hypothetical protein